MKVLAVVDLQTNKMVKLVHTLHGTIQAIESITSVNHTVISTFKSIFAYLWNTAHLGGNKNKYSLETKLQAIKVHRLYNVFQNDINDDLSGQNIWHLNA